MGARRNPHPAGRSAAPRGSTQPRPHRQTANPPPTRSPPPLRAHGGPSRAGGGRHRGPGSPEGIFPFERGAYAAFSRPFVLFGGGTPELDTVYLEHPLKTVFLGDSEANDEYGKMFERLASLALAPVDPEAPPESHDGRDSLSLIQHVMYEL
ncbi:Scr1 family TA system antitoxin-like transcriptional regulator [Streptomyces sp. NPDC057654]|uniref:Scr1 family TA system antitoxin-like transcriptional regulator n=1 Tax=Streptomyces sp. NPDC057654 TaxID=3346196 RepID=UPI0036B18318